MLKGLLNMIGFGSGTNGIGTSNLSLGDSLHTVRLGTQPFGDLSIGDSHFIPAGSTLGLRVGPNQPEPVDSVYHLESPPLNNFQPHSGFGPSFYSPLFPKLEPKLASEIIDYKTLIFRGWADRLGHHYEDIYDRFALEIADFLRLGDSGLVFGRAKNSLSILKKLESTERQIQKGDPKAKVECLGDFSDAFDAINDGIGMTVIAEHNTAIIDNFISNLASAIEEPSDRVRVRVLRIRPYRGQHIENIVPSQSVRHIVQAMEYVCNERPTVLSGKDVIKESGYTACQFDLHVEVYDDVLGDWRDVHLDLHVKELGVFLLGDVEHFVYKIRKGGFLPDELQTPELLQVQETYAQLTEEQKKQYFDYCQQAYTNVIRSSRRASETDITTIQLRQMLGPLPEGIDSRLCLANIYSLLPPNKTLDGEYYKPGDVQEVFSSGRISSSRTSDESWGLRYGLNSNQTKVSALVNWFTRMSRQGVFQLIEDPQFAGLVQATQIFLTLSKQDKTKFLKLLTQAEISLHDGKSLRDHLFHKFPEELHLSKLITVIPEKYLRYFTLDADPDAAVLDDEALRVIDYGSVN